MDHYAGIDVLLECSSVCVVEASGKIVREAKVASEPEALIAWFGELGLALARIGLEAGPLSQWLYAAMKAAGLAVELLETRHVRKAFEAMPVKSDRNDARGIAQLMRLGWFRPVHCKSIAAQEIRAMLTARKLVQSKLLDIENSLRGILRGFGLKVGKITPKNFAGRIEALVEGHPNLQTIGEALLRARAVLLAELNGFEKRVRAMSRLHAQARLGDPERFELVAAAGSSVPDGEREAGAGEIDRHGAAHRPEAEDADASLGSFGHGRECRRNGTSPARAATGMIRR